MIDKINDLWRYDNITAEGVYELFDLDNFNSREDKETFVKAAKFRKSLEEALLEKIRIWSE